MKAPSWMVIEMGRRADDGKTATFTVRVRKWHPMFWWVAFQMLVLGRDPLTRKADR